MLTATPTAADRISLFTCPVTTWLLELFQECVDNGNWMRLLYEMHGGIEKLTFIHKIAARLTIPPSSCQPVWRPACERRWVHHSTVGERRPMQRGVVSALRPAPPSCHHGKRQQRWQPDYYGGWHHHCFDSRNECFPPSQLNAHTFGSPVEMCKNCNGSHLRQQQVLCHGHKESNPAIGWRKYIVI